MTGCNDIPAIMIELVKIKIKSEKIQLKYHYEVVVATSAMVCKKGFAPHTGARAIPPILLDT